jgi:serine O-acetyltransferase
MNGKDEQKISSELPDWSRETPRRVWDPSCKILRTIRRYKCWHHRRGLVGYFIRG